MKVKFSTLWYVVNLNFIHVVFSEIFLNNSAF